MNNKEACKSTTQFVSFGRDPGFVNEMANKACNCVTMWHTQHVNYWYLFKEADKSLEWIE